MDPTQGLYPRILDMAVQGHRSANIADALDVSVAFVDFVVKTDLFRYECQDRKARDLAL